VGWRRRVVGKDGVTQLVVDPTFMAARVALRPLDYRKEGIILGHYRVYSEEDSQSSSAGDPFFELAYGFGPGAVSINLGKSSLVLLRLIMNVLVISTGGGNALADYDAIVIREITVPVTAARFTPIKLRGTMRESATLVSGQGGASGSNTPDSSPFSFAVFPNNNTLGNTATLWQGAQPAILYDMTTKAHPIVCANQEGIRIRVITGVGGGAKFRKRILAEWAEVLVY